MQQVHPVAELFPMMSAAELERLATDIKTYGQRRPIVYDAAGILLDGRNRRKACELAGVEALSEVFDGDDPAAFILSTNARTRHMNESQRAMVAAGLANMRHGGDRKSDQAEILPLDPNGLISQESAAEILNVSDRTIRHAVVVRATDDADLIHAVLQDAIAVSKAVTVAKEPAAFRAAVLRRIAEGLKPTEAIRQTRKEFLPAKVAQLPAGTFRVIYADPPWQYNDARRTDDHRQTSAAFEHYGDMTIDQLCALDVKSIAADDAVLLMWATCPMLPEQLRVVGAWGFTYKTFFVWDKRHGSFGHYHDAEVELLIIATRGSCPAETASKEKQIQRFKRKRRHSEKPEEWRTLIDRLWPHGPRVELFRRGGVPAGWETWGAEAAAEIAA